MRRRSRWRRFAVRNKRVTAALTPSFLAMVARALIRRGEYVAVLDVMPGRGLAILPARQAGMFAVDRLKRTGGIECDLAGPSGAVSRTVPSAACFALSVMRLTRQGPGAGSRL